MRDFYPGSRIQGQKDSRIPDPHQRIQVFNPKIVSKLSEIWSNMFIPDQDLDFLPIPDPGVKKAPNSGYATLYSCLKKYGPVAPG